MQNLPLDRETDFLLLAFRWRFILWLLSWGGNAFPHSYTAFFYTFEMEPVALPWPCHSCSFGLPTSYAYAYEKEERSLVPTIDAGGIFFIMFDFPAFHICLLKELMVLCLCLGGHNKNTVDWVA